MADQTYICTQQTHLLCGTILLERSFPSTLELSARGSLTTAVLVMAAGDREGMITVVVARMPRDGDTLIPPFVSAAMEEGTLVVGMKEDTVWLVAAEEGLKDPGTLVVTAVETLVVEGALIVLVTSLLGRAMVVVMGKTMVVVMATVDVGVGQNIVEVNVEGQLSFSVVAVTTKGDTV